MSAPPVLALWKSVPDSARLKDRALAVRFEQSTLALVLLIPLRALRTATAPGLPVRHARLDSSWIIRTRVLYHRKRDHIVLRPGLVVYLCVLQTPGSTFEVVALVQTAVASRGMEFTNTVLRTHVMILTHRVFLFTNDRETHTPMLKRGGLLRDG
jgi:hypothetical protein